MHERSGIPFRRMTAIGFSVSLLAVLAGCGGTSLPRHAASDSSEVSDTAAAETKREAERPAASEETSTVTGAPAATSQSPPTVEQNMLASRAGSNASGNPPAAALVPPQRFRLPDDRPALNRDELMAEGVRVVESEHLILVTDLPLESVVDLPPLADALFATLEQRLGKLAPDIAGTKFQVTGFD